MEKKLLKDYNDMEKGAYLGAISSIATADHSASDEEIEYIMAVADTADLSPEQKRAVHRAATELTGQELKKCLDILKNSDLKYSLVTDLISFAESDKKYSEEEKANVEKISQYLGINEQQFNLLDQFVKNTAETQPEPEEINKPSFLSKLGLEQKFQNSGINISSLTKGLLGVAAPIILANLMRGRQGRGMGA
ncbi:MAG TPA: TerB family tellurite resistance protein, partial [Chitinophagaceae bacterium]|nr:TerB family tellurite resistance protein [Chitinophagaceae bacterium]